MPIFGEGFPSMPNITISTDGIEKLLTDLKPNKATGPDDIPARILKMGHMKLHPPWRPSSKKSVESRTLPDIWRRPNISPIFKKGDRTKPNNYRPVSLTYIVCKGMEHVVHLNNMHYLDQYHMIYWPINSTAFANPVHGSRNWSWPYMWASYIYYTFNAFIIMLFATRLHGYLVSGSVFLQYYLSLL